MYQYYRFYKPYGYLSQFTDEGNKQGLKHLLNVDADVYAVGRLDSDSEGLLLLTNDKRVNQLLLNPRHSHTRSYLVQVDGAIDDKAIMLMEMPMQLRIKKKTHVTLPAKAEKLNTAPDLPERDPPVRFRANIPTSWIRLVIREGKNRQVRKMTAHVGFPTLRLVRESIEQIDLGGMKPGDIEAMDEAEFYRLLRLKK